MMKLPVRGFAEVRRIERSKHLPAGQAAETSELEPNFQGQLHFRCWWLTALWKWLDEKTNQNLTLKWFELLEV
jgi:hypothetical protein